MTNFGDLTNIENIERKNIFNEERGDVSFYCKNCQKIVEVDRPNKEGYVFICKECKSKNIAIGTESGLKEKYKIN